MRIANFFIFICFIGIQALNAQSEVLRAVKDENRSAVLYQLRLGADLNEQFKPEKYTPLSYAIKQGCSKNFIIWLLEREIDPNKQNNGKTPLMYAIKYESIDLIPLLISYGAEINKKNSATETALIYAVKLSKEDAIKTLLAAKADTELLDYKNNSAITYAKKIGNQEIMKLFGLEKELQINRDGPYAYLTDSDSILITNTIPKADSFIFQEIFKPLIEGKAKIQCTSDQGRVSHSFEIEIDINNIPSTPIPDTLPETVYVLSDLNGNFHSLRSFLVNNKLIDMNLNWIAGEAHLILLGDVFAFGDNVTASLWLIYKLSQQANKSNGGVHFILGNREIEALMGQAQNLHLKYRDIETVSNRAYEDQFGPNSVLGSWLRKQPMMIKMDSFIFSHAGLNPELIEQNISVKNMNKILKKTLINPEKLSEEDQILSAFILGDSGPSRYKKMASEELDEKTVEDICTFFGIKTIIQGQKQVKRSKYLYNKRLLLTNTPKPINSKEGKPAGIVLRKGYPLVIKDIRKVIEI